MKKSMLRTVLGVLGVLVMTLVLEVGVFNFRAWQSRGYTPLRGEMVLLEGIRDNGDGTITVLEEGERGIEYTQLNASIKNAYVNIATPAGDFGRFEVFLMSTDAGNALYLPHPTVTVVTSEPSSHYIKMNLAGQTPKMKLRLDGLAGQTIILREVCFNVSRPLEIMPLRMVMVFCILSFLYLLRMRGMLFSQTLEKPTIAGWVCVLLVCVVLCGTLVGAMGANPLYEQAGWENHEQYKWLARSLAKGQFSLDRVVSPELEALENPYDPYARWNSGAAFDWDCAYYEGAYYVYFGVVPCVLFYLPFYVLTGYGLDNLWVLLAVMPLFVVGLFSFFYQLLRRYVPKTRFAVYLLLSSTAALGCGMMYTVRHPDFYSVPIVTGLMLSVWGMTLWLHAQRGKKNLRRGALALGSLCMALVAGCRPQLVVFSGFALFFFAPWVRGKRVRKGDWVAFWLPYVVVAALLMYYNAARFGSPFDFGANYNLTTTDMTKLGLNIERAPIALFTSFLQPPNLTTAFPYLQPADVRTAFQGTLVVDTMMGGLLWSSPVIWFGALCFLWREELKAAKAWGLCVYGILGALGLCAFDTMGAGLLYRYMLDFGLLAFVPAVLTCAVVIQNREGASLRRNYTVIRLLCMCTFAFAFLMIVLRDYASLYDVNASLYEHLRMMVEFWY